MTRQCAVITERANGVASSTSGITLNAQADAQNVDDS